MILFVGDIHGNVSAVKRAYEDAVSNGARAIIQVGDFGIYWPGESNGLSEFFNKNDLEIPFYFCDGNHENHEVLDRFYYHQKRRVVEVAKNCFHVRRGSVLDINDVKVLFCGGAQSYLGKKDTPFILGENWWPREMPSWQEFSRFRKNFEKADIVATHDCPSFLLSHQSYHKQWSKNAVPQFFSRIVQSSSAHPSMWFFGHHHEHDVYVTDRTNYYCCGKHGESWLYTEKNCVKTGQRVVK